MRNTVAFRLKTFIKPLWEAFACMAILIWWCHSVYTTHGSSDAVDIVMANKKVLSNKEGKFFSGSNHCLLFCCVVFEKKKQPSFRPYDIMSVHNSLHAFNGAGIVRWEHAIVFLIILHPQLQRSSTSCYNSGFQGCHTRVNLESSVVGCS